MTGADAFAMHMDRAARFVLGQPNPGLSSRREVRFGSKGSVSVDLARGIWRDHENHVGGGVLEFLKQKGGMSTADALTWLSLDLEREPPPRRDVPKSKPTAADRTALALRIWREAREPAGDPVEIYLARRGLALPPEAGEVIRYHPACPFAGSRTPAMIALVRNVLTDAPQAVHRTALTLDGRKAVVAGRDRAALGPLAGGAVKLTADAEVTTCLGIGEGIESTLSLRRLPEFGDTPVWSLLNTAGVSGFLPMSGIECLWLAVDHDPGGEKAARACAGRWRFAGRETFLVTPSAAGTDLNDLLRGAPHG